MARNGWRSAVVWGVFFALLNLTGVREILADDPDQPKIQGTWELVGAERNGQPATDEEIKKRPLKLVFNGQSFVPYEGQRGEPGDSDKGSFKLDSTKSPKQIDITRNNEEKNKIIGIYELNGDDLKLAVVPVMDETPPERPKEFKSGGQSMVLVLKRTKK